jgi:hypothetical protein
MNNWSPVMQNVNNNPTCGLLIDDSYHTENTVTTVTQNLLGGGGGEKIQPTTAGVL